MFKKITIGFIGEVSTGKSTCVNSIIGDYLGETKLQRTTYSPFEFIHSQTTIKSKIIKFNKEQKTNGIQQFNVNMSWIINTKLNKKLSLIDFPGFNDALDSNGNMEKILDKNLKNINCLFYIIEPRLCTNKHSFDLVLKIINKVKKLRLEFKFIKFIIIFNKYDEEDTEKDKLFKNLVNFLQKYIDNFNIEYFKISGRKLMVKRICENQGTAGLQKIPLNILKKILSEEFGKKRTNKILKKGTSKNYNIKKLIKKVTISADENKFYQLLEDLIYTDKFYEEFNKFIISRIKDLKFPFNKFSEENYNQYFTCYTNLLLKLKINDQKILLNQYLISDLKQIKEIFIKCLNFKIDIIYKSDCHKNPLNIFINLICNTATCFSSASNTNTLVNYNIIFNLILEYIKSIEISGNPQFIYYQFGILNYLFNPLFISKIPNLLNKVSFLFKFNIHKYCTSTLIPEIKDNKDFIEIKKNFFERLIPKWQNLTNKCLISLTDTFIVENHKNIKQYPRSFCLRTKNGFRMITNYINYTKTIEVKVNYENDNCSTKVIKIFTDDYIRNIEDIRNIDFKVSNLILYPNEFVTYYNFFEIEKIKIKEKLSKFDVQNCTFLNENDSKISEVQTCSDSFNFELKKGEKNKEEKIYNVNEEKEHDLCYDSDEGIISSDDDDDDDDDDCSNEKK